MNGIHRRRRGPGLTIAQMMKLVVFGAAASLCLLPMQALVEEGVVTWPTVLIWEAVAIPLSQAVVAFALVKPGRFRDGLVLGLVGISLLVALGTAIYLLVQGVGMPGATPAFLFWVILLLVVPLRLVLLCVLPGPCPRCSRSWLITDGTIRRRPRSPLRRAYRCDSCRQRFWWHRGAWEVVPVDPAPPLDRPPHEVPAG
jgi:hypothetical protein